MLTHDKHFLKMQKKVAKKVEEKLGIPINTTLSSSGALRYDVEARAIHEITEKVAKKYCEKHGLPAPVVSRDGIRIKSGTFSGFTGLNKYVIFNW